MNIGNVNSQFAMYSFQSSQTMSKDQMSTIIEAGNKIQQAPANQKMVNQVNKSLERMHVDIMA